MNWLHDLIFKNLIYIAGVLGLGLSYLILAVLSDKASTFFKNVWHWAKHIFHGKREKELLNKQIVELYNNIRSTLIELRVNMDADRVYIHEFHNGETFLSNKPRWKMSRTFEVCREGISYEDRKLQNLDVTLFWDSVKTFFSYNEKELVDGVNVFRKKPLCKLEFCILPRTVFLFDRDRMNPNEGQTKIALETQNVKYALCSPLLNHDNQAIGYIGIDYCNKEKFELVINNPKFSTCYLCRAAAEIALAWELNPQIKKKMLETYKEKFGFLE